MIQTQLQEAFDSIEKLLCDTTRGPWVETVWGGPEFGGKDDDSGIKSKWTTEHIAVVDGGLESGPRNTTFFANSQELVSKLLKCTKFLAQNIYTDEQQLEKVLKILTEKWSHHAQDNQEG